MYVTLDLFKRAMSIPDNDLDEEVINRVEDSNDQVDQLIKPFVDSVPLPAGSPYIPYARQAALEYCKHLWAEYTVQLDKARYHYEIYDKKAQALVTAIKADRPSRTKTVLVTKDPKDERLTLPAQRLTFILDS